MIIAQYVIDQIKVKMTYFNIKYCEIQLVLFYIYGWIMKYRRRYIRNEVSSNTLELNNKPKSKK